MKSGSGSHWLSSGLVLALLATILVTSGMTAAEAESAAPQPMVGASFETSGGTSVQVAADGTYVITPAGKSAGERQNVRPTIRLISGDIAPGPDDSFALGGPDADTNEVGAYIVQFVTRPIEDYRRDLESLGAEVHGFVADQAHIVRMTPTVAAQVSELPHVRWIGALAAEQKMTDSDWQNHALSNAGDAVTYGVLLVDTSPQLVADVMQELAVNNIEIVTASGSSFLELSLTADELRTVLGFDEVIFAEPTSGVSADTNVARDVGGANYIENVRGYDGSGVNVAVVDDALFVGHREFRSNPPTVLTENPVFEDDKVRSHGTLVSGVIFSEGVRSRNRGIAPGAKPLFISYEPAASYDPGAYIPQLADPAGPYQASVMVQAFGRELTTGYTALSSYVDDLLFNNDILLVQSQGNQGNQMSRPTANAKNVVSVGGVYHWNNTISDDDRWYVPFFRDGQLVPPASIGPVSDGRIKPDFVHFYDRVTTTSVEAAGRNNTYADYGGTSMSTPIIGGYFALLYEMWSDGVFDDMPGVLGSQRYGFAQKPAAATMRALAVNTAAEYEFEGEDADLTRTHQGWGQVNARNAYDMGINGQIPIVVDENVLLGEFDTASFSVDVADRDNCGLRASLVYTDPAGSPIARVHRVNDLSLRLTAPDGTVYWGNNGLREGNWSTPGGTSNNIDTTENVFIDDADDGAWTINVLVEELNEDGHPETAALDADFGLVVSGNCIEGSMGDHLDVAMPEQQPFNDAINNAPVRIEAENYDLGGEGIAYHDVDAANRGGAYRTNEAVDLWATYRQPGGFTLGGTRDTEWTEYSIDVTKPADYVVQVRVASGRADPGSIIVSIDGRQIGEIDVDNTGGWWAWRTESVPAVGLDAGRHIVQLKWVGQAEINVDWFELLEADAIAAPSDKPCDGQTQEAENGRLVGNFKRIGSADANGAAYVAVPTGTGNLYNFTDANYVEVCIVVPSAGEYRIDAVVLAANSREDSFWVQVGSGPRWLWDVKQSSGWIVDQVSDRGGQNPVVVSLDAGEHRVRFYQREDGTRLDAVTFSDVALS